MASLPPNTTTEERESFYLAKLIPMIFNEEKGPTTLEKATSLII